MKINVLKEDLTKILNESKSVSEAKLLVQNYLWNSIDDFMDGLAVNVASNVPLYDLEWCIEVLDPSTDVELKETKQHLIEIIMNMLFAYAEEEDEPRNLTTCETCGAYLNEIGTCPVCDEGEEDYFNESVLNEGPGLRSLGRAIANKISPKNAVKREIKGHEKDEKEYRKKKATPVMSKDFSTKSQRYRFIPNKKNAKPMNYDEWMKEYGSVAKDPKNPKYSEWYNAIVVDEDGYMIRRGSEDVSRKLDKYSRGNNDEIMSMYRVSPYVYNDKIVGEEEDTTGDTDKTKKPDNPETTSTPVENTPKDEPLKKDPESDSKKDPQDPTTDKEPVTTDEPQTKEISKKTSKKQSAPVKKETPVLPVTKQNLSRFIKLCQLTSLRVYAKDALDKQLTTNDLKQITPEVLDQYVVRSTYRPNYKVPLDVWMQTAKNQKFLEKLDNMNDIDSVDEGEILNESSGYPYFLQGDEVVDGMFGNMPEKEFDKQYSLLRKISRLLSLRSVKDLVVYCDTECIYDPTAVDGRYFRLPAAPTVFEINGIKLVSEIINGNVMLYFASEYDALSYMKYVDDLMN